MQVTEAHSIILSRKDCSTLKEAKADINHIGIYWEPGLKFHQDSISSSSFLVYAFLLHSSLLLWKVSSAS